MELVQRLWAAVGSFATLVGIYAMEPLVAAGPVLMSLLVVPNLFLVVLTVFGLVAVVRVAVHEVQRRRDRRE